MEAFEALNSLKQPHAKLQPFENFSARCSVTCLDLATG